jgi:hypothetical protein
VGACGEAGDGEIFTEIGAYDVEQAGERGAFGLHRGVDELRLPAAAVGRDHQASCHPVGDGGAEVAADQMQAEVDPGGAAGRRQDLALVDIEQSGSTRISG